MILTERHIIKKTNPLYSELDNLCFLSKNLYNSALYTVRQYYFENKKYLSWVNINNNFVKGKQVDYYALPCKVSQQTLKMVDQNMKSFFNAIKAKKSKAKLPKYLDKVKGRFVVTYTNQAIGKKALQNGYVELSKTNIKIKTKVKNVKQVRIVPQNNFIVVEVLYEVRPKPHDKSKEMYCGIDFGLNNLMTCSFQNNSPLIINGKPLKSIIWHYNKEKSRLQSLLDGRKKTSKRIQNIALKRNNRINDYLHKTTKIFVNYLVSKEINNVVIGYNKEWKQGINIGRVNNQNFVGIPYYKLLNMLTYKCELEGISVIVTEESYTSKCSFLDDEDICKHEEYYGKRIKRGLYKASDGRLINADVNGALNILKKVIGKFEYDSIKVCSTPLVVTP